ncbi:hypothetical protein SDC9_178675 [bioreactor metagenome]|uniref:Uncharacterized protein n=1 Tax=bioreactor metagenome TaxID=1076179 RepID=A0A645GWD2_9ZZZZ
MVDIGQQIAGFGTENARLDGLAAADDFQRVGQGFRLLEDFLLHVVPIGAEFDGCRRQLGDMDRTLDGRAVEAGDADPVGSQFGDVAVFQVDHVAGNLQQRRSVGCGVVAGVGNAQQQRRTLARDDDLAWLGVVDDGNGVGADQALAGEANGLEQVGLGFE